VKPKPLPLKRTTKSLLTQLQLRSDFEDGDDTAAEDLDLHVAYRRPEVVRDSTITIIDDDEELSDYVKFRLYLARQLAMKKYYEKWT